MALVATTWNPADKGSACTLSNGNLTGTAPSVNGTVRSIFGASSGKWYWEIKTTSSTYSPGIGVGTSAAALTTYAGSTSGGWAWYSSEGKKYTAGVATSYGTAGSIAGATIGVALDMDAGTVTIYKNGVSLGVMYSGLTGTVYALCGGNASTPSDFTANFGASAFDYSPPAGHTAGFGGSTYTLSGVTKDATNTPAARLVRAYREDTGALAASVTSNATTGAYTLDVTSNGAHTIHAYPAAGESLPALILRGVTPV